MQMFIKGANSHQSTEEKGKNITFGDSHRLIFCFCSEHTHTQKQKIPPEKLQEYFCRELLQNGSVERLLD